MKLNDEKKFFINKNLFENASTQLFKPIENIPNLAKPSSDVPA